MVQDEVKSCCPDTSCSGSVVYMRKVEGQLALFDYSSDRELGPTEGFRPALPTLVD